MEVHTPKRHVTSLKEFLRELVTIVAGVVIALSFEGVTGWKHHRDLVHEARANITSEVRENQRELEKQQQELKRMVGDIQNLIDVVHKLESDPHTPVTSFRYQWTLAELQSTSWESARTTGAISYMPYTEVKAYTQLYGLQQAFEELQQRAFNSSLDVVGLATLLQRKPGTISASELHDAERRLGIVLANVGAMQDLTRPLSERYGAMLKGAE